MGAEAYKDAVELAVDRWNAHDEQKGTVADSPPVNSSVAVAIGPAS
jgi:hypothetical protein